MITLSYKLDNDENLLFKTTSKKGIHPYIKIGIFAFMLFYITFGSIGLYLISTFDEEIIIKDTIYKEQFEEDKLLSIAELKKLEETEQKKITYPNYLTLIQKGSLSQILFHTPIIVSVLALSLLFCLYGCSYILIKNSNPSNIYIFTNQRIIEINKQTQTSYYWNIFIPEIKTYKRTISLRLKMFVKTRSETHISRYYPVPFHLFFNEQDNIEVLKILENHIIQDKKI